jgi:hypothetical protein
MEITWTRHVIGFAGLLVAAGTATAQTTAQGYAVAGRGMYANRFSSGPVTQFGGGAEALIQKRFGIGGEMAAAVGGSDGWIASSLNACLHFPPHNTKPLVPFISGVTPGWGRSQHAAVSMASTSAEVSRTGCGAVRVS